MAMISQNDRVYILYLHSLQITTKSINKYYAVAKLSLMLFTYKWWNEEINLNNVAHSTTFTVFAVYL